jgi:hypothetical protein
MHAEDLTRPLKPTPRQQRRRSVLPIAVGISGVFTGLVILFGAGPDRGKSLSPVSMPQPAPAESAQQTAAVPAPAPATPRPKTITLTVIDSQTGARREVVVPASTDNQSEESKPAPARSAATITPADTARGTAKSKRH